MITQWEISDYIRRSVSAVSAWSLYFVRWTVLNFLFLNHVPL